MAALVHSPKTAESAGGVVANLAGALPDNAAG
jgi:hypothetical protein